VEGFEKAFPAVHDCKIVVTYSDLGKSAPLPSVFTKANLSQRVACPNRLCRRGGLDVGFKLHQAVADRLTTFEYEASCAGDEGSPGGRRKGQHCLFHFTVKGTITYKESGISPPS
jgi:hypothetical protein